MSDFLSFHLPGDFVAQYASVQPRWGFDIGGGNSLSELTFLTKYSRKKEDGTKERWYETCERVINGTYSLLKDHCKANRTPWNETKAMRSAEDAYERLFNFKWTPPGRGLWMMGTAFVHEERNSAPLQNCGFISTEKISSRSVYEATMPFTRLMDMSMHGIGVGFDSRGADKLTIHEPTEETITFVIPDSREGWVESVGLLLESYFFANRPTVIFDYSLIRKAGEPLKRFGGTAAGPGPLMDLHRLLRELLGGRDGQKLSSLDIGDIMNLEGKCVVAGSIRRSAEIWLGDEDDEQFLDAKNWEINPVRMGQDGWGGLSNNSIIASVGKNYDHLVDRIINNGEPGLFYLDLARSHGRLADPRNDRDHRVVGVNPCAEQSLEHLELCTLVETFPHYHEDYDDFRQTLKAAYLYAKAVTLLPTQWPESNEVMQRNRRIGCSMSGLAQFVEDRGISVLRQWMDDAYDFICHRDQVYSEWLGVRESIKKSSIKPSGTVSLITGSTPGGNWPTDVWYIRRQRFAALDPEVEVFRAAGYHVEPDVTSPKYTVVVSFPTRGPLVRTEKEVSVWEKAHLVAAAQRHWADNQVSSTLTFRKDEESEVGPLLRNFDGQFKAISLLPITEQGAYKQMPYESIDEATWEEMSAKIKPLDWSVLYGSSSKDAEGERFCTTDRCELPA